MLHKVTAKMKVENVYFNKSDSVKVWVCYFLPSLPATSAQGELQGVQEHF